MARNFTIAALILKGRRACDQVDSDLLSPAEWQDEFSSIYAEFQKAVIEGGARVFESEQTITGDGNRNYALPADFMSEIGVEWETSGGDRVDLHPLAIQERSIGRSMTGRSRYYSMIGDDTRLEPPPDSGTYYLTYVPQPTDYSEVADTTEVDVIVPAGEQFFKWSLAAIGAGKEESPQAGYFEAKAERAREDLVKWSYNRSLTQPRRKVVGVHPLEGSGYEPGDYEY